MFDFAGIESVDENAAKFVGVSNRATHGGRSAHKHLKETRAISIVGADIQGKPAKVVPWIR